MQSVIDTIAALGLHQRLLRAGMVLAMVAGLFLTAAAATGPTSPLALLVLPAAAAAAIRPDSHVPAIALVLFVWQWWADVDDVGTPWTAGAALVVLVFHAAAALASVGPPGASLPRAVWLRWVRKIGVATAGAVVASAAVVLLADADLGGNVAVAVTGALAIVALTALLWPRDATA